MKRLLLAATFVVIWALAWSPAMGAQRFPQPDFESGYEFPATTAPQPSPVGWEYFHLAVLTAALALAAYLALKVRSRGALWALMIFSLVYFGFWRLGCICPVGSPQNVVLAVADASYAVPIFVIGFFALPLVFALLFGRVFCAAVCPLGAIQDVVAVRPVRVPAWLEHSLGMLPYVYLSLMVIFAATGAGFLVCRFDPFVSIFRMSGHAWILAAGAGLLVMGIFVARPFCRFLCPYGVLLAWTSRFSKWHLGITPDECVKCRLCENSCPFGAIQRPTPERIAEQRETGVRRLALLALLAPVLVGGGAVAGWYAGEPLSRAHKTVYTAEALRGEAAGETGETTLESEAFMQAGRPVAELYAEALDIRGDFRFGGMLAGVFLGIVFAFKLISLSVYRRREDYEIDRGRCLSCGRCFDSCPREHLRRKEKRGAKA